MKLNWNLLMKNSRPIITPIRIYIRKMFYFRMKESLFFFNADDNIFEENFYSAVQKFKSGAQIFLKRIPDPERFGVPTLLGSQVIKITEKPRKPASPFAVTGFYIFDSRVFSVIKKLQPSRRNELEITDVSNWFIKHGEVKAHKLKGFWSDAGTPQSLFCAANFVQKMNCKK